MAAAGGGTGVPKAEHAPGEGQAAMQALSMVAEDRGPTTFAHIRALKRRSMRSAAERCKTSNRSQIDRRDRPDKRGASLFPNISMPQIRNILNYTASKRLSAN
jgi:hypothetical protein